MVQAVVRSAAWRSNRSRFRSKRKRITNSTDMTRRFWVAVVLTIPVFALGMSDLIPGQPLQRLVPMSTLAMGATDARVRRWCCGVVGRSSCAPGSRS